MHTYNTYIIPCTRIYHSKTGKPKDRNAESDKRKMTHLTQGNTSKTGNQLQKRATCSDQNTAYKQK